MTEHSGPTLTDAKGMGGDNAQNGFDYQLWDALVRLPAWLRTPVFEGLIVEGLEDVEARFFAAHAADGYFLDRFQAKSAGLARGEVLEVFRGFAAFDDAYPERARTQVLVTPDVPKVLQWLSRDADRVRRARPFYAPFADILTASEVKFERDVIEEFGEELGLQAARQVARSMQVDRRPYSDRGIAEARFAMELRAAFPHLNPRPGEVTSAFSTRSCWSFWPEP
jgi:hypothetical protein